MVPFLCPLPLSLQTSQYWFRPKFLSNTKQHQHHPSSKSSRKIRSDYHLENQTKSRLGSSLSFFCYDEQGERFFFLPFSFFLTPFLFCFLNLYLSLSLSFSFSFSLYFSFSFSFSFSFLFLFVPFPFPFSLFLFFPKIVEVLFVPLQTYEMIGGKVYQKGSGSMIGIIKKNTRFVNINRCVLRYSF